MKLPQILVDDLDHVLAAIRDGHSARLLQSPQGFLRALERQAGFQVREARLQVTLPDELKSQPKVRRRMVRLMFQRETVVLDRFLNAPAVLQEVTVLFARSLWSTESERSTGLFADFYEPPAGHVNGCLPCLGMNRTYRVRQTYDHRLRDAIAATGNAELFRDVAIPASTRRTWARGEVRPVVAAVDVELEVYDLLEHVDRPRQRARAQAAIIGLQVQLLNLRGGKLDGDRVPDGASKSAVLRAVASAAGLLSLSTALKIVGISSARYHAWRRRGEGSGLDDQPSCPKSFPSQLTRDEVSTMRDCVESETYRHIAVQNLALYAQRLGKVFASASTWYKMICQRGWKRPRRRVHPAKPKQGLRATCPNEYWQIDATVIRLTTGIRIYL